MLNNKEIDINEIEVHDAVIERGVAIASKMNECVPGTLCKVLDYFEMITECALCGKLC